MELSVYLGRMPIIDEEGRIYAYELLHRSTDSNYTVIDDNLHATARVLVNALNYIGLQTLTGGKPAFIKVDDKAIFDDLIFCISQKHFVLEILETSTISSDFVQRVQELHKDGYTFALKYYKLDNDFLLHFKEIFPFITYIKIDIRHSTRVNIATALAPLSSLNTKLIAEKVEDEDDYEWAKNAGFDYFEGYYFSKPQIYVKDKTDPKKRLLFTLIYLLKSEASFEEITSVFNDSPYLSVNLFKFIHMHNYTDNEKISSIEQALILLGRDRLTHWIELMIYAQKNDESDDSISTPLGNIAKQRAVLMEELARLMKENTDDTLLTSAYLIGILSLAEAMFQSSFETLLEQMSLDKHITNALLHKKGLLGELLQLCIAVEKNDFEVIDTLLSRLRLSKNQLNQAMMQGYKRTSLHKG